MAGPPKGKSDPSGNKDNILYAASASEARVLKQLITEKGAQADSGGSLGTLDYKTPKTYLCRLMSRAPRAQYWVGGTIFLFTAQVAIVRMIKYANEGLPPELGPGVGDQVVWHYDLQDPDQDKIIRNAYNLCPHDINMWPHVEPGRKPNCGEILVFCVEDMFGDLYIVHECDICFPDSWSSSACQHEVKDEVIVSEGNLRRDGDYVKVDRIGISIMNGKLCVRDVDTVSVYICCPDSSSSGSA